MTVNDVDGNTISDIEQELAETKARLAAVEKEYAEFVYIVSHDFAAPFRHIEGFAKLIQKRIIGVVDEATSQHFEHIIKATNQCKGMLAALLQFSRLKADRDAFTQVDCNRLVDDVKVKLALLIDNKNARLHYEHLPTLNTHMNHLHQIFEALIRNALTYTQENRFAVITVSAEEKDGRTIFCVADNGMGIHPRQRDEVTNFFRRCVPQSHSEGLGVGLSMVEKIVTMYGGELRILSHIDEEVGENGDAGTEVYFTCPQ